MSILSKLFLESQVNIVLLFRCYRAALQMTQYPGYMNWLRVWSKKNMNEHFKSCFTEISLLLLVITTYIGFSLNYIRYQMESWTVYITVFFEDKPMIRHAIR